MAYPLAFDPRLAGQHVRLRLAINAAGLMERMTVEGPLAGDADFTASATRQLGYWLFLPRTRDGRELPSTLVLPLAL